MDKIKKYGVILICVILILISIVSRIPNIKEKYKCGDASEHTLLTMQCYEETPASVHKFLPIVSLGQEEDKNIPWGECAKDDNGNYYYTSFSPAGFAIPYFFIKTLNLPINIYSLYAFNSLLYVLSFIITTCLFCKLFKKYLNKNIITIFTALIYLFQIEIMHCQGVIYWVHSIMQVLLPLQFLMFLNRNNSKGAKIGFYIMCVINPYIEWTGFVSNVIYAIILFADKIAEEKKLTLKAFIKPLIIALLTILALALYIGHFSLAIDVNTFISIMKNRFVARDVLMANQRQEGIEKLIEGYFISFKYLIFLIAVMFIFVITTKKNREMLWKMIKEYKYELIYFSGIMLENILMMQHATQYSFDRMKFIFLLLIFFYILSAVIYSSSKKKNMIETVFFIILIVASFANLIEYKTGKYSYIEEERYKQNDIIISEYVNKEYNRENSIMASSGVIRGFMNLTFHRGIYELQTYKQAQELAVLNQKRYAIFCVIDKEDSRQLGILAVKIKDMEKNTEKILTFENNSLVILEK